jgi:hypothetical protein
MALLGWVALLGIRELHGHPLSSFTLLYNVPISAIFAGLGTALALEASSSCDWGAYVPLAAVWGLGLAVLYLRLVTKTIDVSGHMTWAVLIGLECLAERRPVWFTGFAWAVAAFVLGLKWLVLGGRSGSFGLVAGLALGGLAALAAPRRAGHGTGPREEIRAR